MDVINIQFVQTTCALSMTFLPDQSVPEEKALMGCVYQLILAFPDDPASVFKYALMIAVVLGFGPPEMRAITEEVAKRVIKNEPKAMAAIAPYPEVADAVNA